MAQNRTSRIRVLRQRGRNKLVKVNDQLNSFTWELFERNVGLDDVNVTRAVAVLDDALSLVQRAGALLNAVHVEDSKKDQPSSEPTGFKGTRDDKDGSATKPNLSRTVSSVN